MSDKTGRAQDARALAQERILDALLRSLALEQPSLLERIRSILIDTEFTHTGKPGIDATVHDQIQNRLNSASRFAEAHGAVQD